MSVLRKANYLTNNSCSTRKYTWSPAEEYHPTIAMLACVKASVNMNLSI